MRAFHLYDLLSSVADEFGVEIAREVPLAQFTTLRLGGPAQALVTCATTEALVGVVRRLDREKVPVLVLAGGSNLVIGDEGVEAVVVRVANAGFEVRDGHLHAEAGAVWDEMVAATVAAGKGGIECLSGIPGSTGATPVQNVGAYGVEVASALRRVQLLDRREGTVSWVDPAALHLTYRHSVLKHSDDALVLAVELELSEDGLSAPVRYRELARAVGVEEGARVPVAQAREAVLGLRRSKGMVLDAPDHDTWSAGSFFTNPIIPVAQLAQVREAVAKRVGPEAVMPQFPDGEGSVKLSAGWLIERAGFTKGFPGEDAPMRLSTKHTLALTNRGAATTGDLVELARTVRDGVEAAFGVTLVPEPVFVGAHL